MVVQRPKMSLRPAEKVATRGLWSSNLRSSDSYSRELDSNLSNGRYKTHRRLCQSWRPQLKLHSPRPFRLRQVQRPTHSHFISFHLISSHFMSLHLLSLYLLHLYTHNMRLCRLPNRANHRQPGQRLVLPSFQPLPPKPCFTIPR